MHRFVWDLTWSSSGGPSADEESEYRSPSGPKVVPGIYTVRLTVNGSPQTQPPKSRHGPPLACHSGRYFNQQLQLGQQIFADTLEARRALAEIGSLQKQLADLSRRLAKKIRLLRSTLANAQTEIANIVNKPATSPGRALRPAGRLRRYGIGTTCCRRWGSRRAFASDCRLQRVQPARQNCHRGMERIQDNQTSQLNQKLSEANLAPIAISEIEQEVQFLMSR